MARIDPSMVLNGQQVRFLPGAVWDDGTVNFDLIDRHLAMWSNRRKAKRFRIYKETVLDLLDLLQAVDTDWQLRTTGNVGLEKPADLLDAFEMSDDDGSMDLMAERLMGDIPHYLERRHTKTFALRCFDIDLDELKDMDFDPDCLSGDALRGLTFERRATLVYCLQILMTLLFGTNKVSDDSMLFNEDIMTWYD